MAPAFLAIDCGSSSCRAAVADAATRQLVPGTLVQRPFSLNCDAEFDAEELFAIAIDVASQSLSLAARECPGAVVELVGVSVFAVTIVCLDSSMKPLWNACSYADKRTFEFAQAARDQMSPEQLQQLYDATGTPFAYPYAPAHIQRLRASKTSVEWSLVHRVCTLGAYIMYRLTGHLRMSFCEAGWTGMFDRERLCWNHTALKAAGNLVEDQLPDLCDACGTQSSLPLLPSCPLNTYLPLHARALPPISDGAAANIGAGCVDNSCACLTVGTSVALRTVVRSRVPPVISSSDGLWSYHLYGDLWLVGGALSDGGNLIAWLLKTMNFHESWESEVASMSPASHGLVILPFASGERSPGYHGNASFLISGARTSSTPSDVMRATMEAVALRVRALWERLIPFMQPNARVVASGGALLASNCWARIFSDAMGATITVCSDNKEASLYGIIFQCAQHQLSASLSSDASFHALDHGNLQLDVLDHDAAAHAVYAVELKRQQHLYYDVFASTSRSQI